jgi:hypothetical protein
MRLKEEIQKFIFKLPKFTAGKQQNRKGRVRHTLSIASGVA